MNRFLSCAMMGVAMAAATVNAQAAEFVYDFVPEVESMVFTQGLDEATNMNVDEVRIDLKFSSDVWWVEGYASKCYLLDSKGEKYEDWTPEFWGPASDYSKLILEVRGLSKYVDEDYTLVIPQGLLGDTAWNSNVDGASSNPELRYEFNEWKLAGCPEPPSDEVVYDYVPEVQSIIYQQTWDTEKEEMVPEVRIDVKFNGDVWWVTGYQGQCYLLDSNGERYDAWWPDFGGLESDYSVMYFGVRGLSQYVDADYTLVIPQGLLGDTNWYYDAPGSRSNPELRYEFNEYKLAGCPREDFTVYDFTPLSDSYSVEEARINGQKQLELQLNLTFPEAVAVHENFKNKVSLYDGEGKYIQQAVIRTVVSNEDPNTVMVGIRGVDLKGEYDFTLSIWEGAFGTLEWAAEDYCESKASPTLEYRLSSAGSAVESMQAADKGSETYNLQGVRVDSDRLAKGIYIRDGKKIIIK